MQLLVPAAAICRRDARGWHTAHEPWAARTALRRLECLLQGCPLSRVDVGSAQRHDRALDPDSLYQ